MEQFERFNEQELERELETLEQNGWIQAGDNDICSLKFSTPAKADVFNAFKLFKPEETQVLILGQDPYPDSNRADGMAFSFKEGQKAADSIKNIFKAIEAYKQNKRFDEINDNDISNYNTNLKQWATDNKVLLLNTALTYEKDNQTTHQNTWQSLINQVILNLFKTSNEPKLVVFLWGKPAQYAFFNSIIKSEEFANNNKGKAESLTRRMIFMTSHPSEQSVHYGFSEDTPSHFRACDEFLGMNIWANFPKNL